MDESAAYNAVSLADDAQTPPNGNSVTEVATCLTPREELQLQQLLQMRFWSGRDEGASGNGARKAALDHITHETLPESWDLTRGFTLHDWQNQCIDAWLKNGKRGVLKVVTGAGKTILGLAIAQQLQRTERKSLRVAVVVPSIVLLNQWRDELTAHGNLPAPAIGSMGGGHSDGFTESTRFLICVLNSASKKLAREVEQAGIAGDLLLIVDECHRAGAAEMRQVFRTPRTFSLGLSATPERDDDPADVESDDQILREDEPPRFEDSVVGQELGPVVFEMNYADAIRRGVLPPFRIVHYGLSLAAKEREKYEGLSRQIKELREDLETGNRRGLALVRWCRSKSGAQDPRAVQFLALTTERKRLLYRMESRHQAVEEILRRAFAQNPNTKAILFHESIEEVMAIFRRLRGAGYAVVAEHSEFPDSMRAESLRLFRQDAAHVIVSARSLIEGFNVPSADLGIVVAASASVRQRVQTLGRLLRRNQTKEGIEKQASLCVLYGASTVDELIYEKADWEHFVGADRNEYFLWTDIRNSEPRPLPGPPRRPPLDETAVDAATLVPGGPYPGDPDQGLQYSVDTQGTVSDEAGNLAMPHEQLRSMLANFHKKSGRFRVTPRNRFVTRLEKTPEGTWGTVYLGQLTTPLEVVFPDEKNGQARRDYSPGDPYPLSLARGKVFSVLQRDKRLIAKKTPGGVSFVTDASHLADARKQAALRQIQQSLATAYARGHRISKITVTEEGDVVYVFHNQAYFVGRAPEGAEGFIFETKGKHSA